MRQTAIALMLALSTSLYAQTPAQKPELSVTEKFAVQSFMQQYNDLQRLGNQLFQDISAHHPGYYLDLHTGKLEPEKKAASPAVKAAPEKK